MKEIDIKEIKDEKVAKLLEEVVSTREVLIVKLSDDVKILIKPQINNKRLIAAKTQDILRAQLGKPALDYDSVKIIRKWRIKKLIL